MRQINSIVLAIIVSLSVRGVAFGQASKELQTQFARLQDRATSDDASVHLRALCHSNPNARRFLADRLPELIMQATPSAWYNPVWLNSVNLAGYLEITEAVPVLAKELDEKHFGPYTTLTMDAKLEDDPVGTALVAIGGPAIESVRSVLENADNSQSVRYRAARVLYNMNSREADAALAHDLQTERDPRIRHVIEVRLENRSKSSPH